MIHRHGPSRVATIYVGLRRGKGVRNRTDRCKVLPEEFSAAYADTVFLAKRAEQVGTHVGATRTRAEGWYESEHEPSAVYQVIHIPSVYEPNPESFVQNMEALAEELSRELCQDAVFVIYDDSHRKEGFDAEWAKPYRKAASHALQPVRRAARRKQRRVTRRGRR